MSQLRAALSAAAAALAACAALLAAAAAERPVGRTRTRRTRPRPRRCAPRSSQRRRYWTTQVEEEFVGVQAGLQLPQGYEKMLKEERHLQQANAPDVDFEAKFMDAGEYAMLEAQASKREEALTVRTPAAQNAVLVNVKKAEDVTQAERRAMPEALVVQMLAAQNSMLEAQASQREEEMPEALVGQMLAAQHTMLEAQASMREEETPEALVGEMLAAQNVMLEAQAERREMPEALVVQMLAAQNAMLEEQASQREEEIPAALVGQTLAAQNAMLEAQAFKREEQTPEALVGQMLAEDVVKPGEEEVFSPTHTTANLCTGKVRAAGLHIKGMDKSNVDLVLGSAAAAVEAEDLDDLVVVTAKEVDVDAVVVSEAAAPQGSAGEAAEADLVLGSAAAAVEVEDLDDPVVVAAKEVDVDDVVRSLWRPRCRGRRSRLPRRIWSSGRQLRLSKLRTWMPWLLPASSSRRSWRACRSR